MSESKFFIISPDGGVRQAADALQAIEAVKQGGFVWLNFIRPPDDQLPALKAELSKLIAPLGLHPLSVEDCMDENQIPKIEDFPSNTFILFNAFNYHKPTLLIDEVDLFLGEKFLITVSGDGTRHPGSLDGVERYLEQGLENARQGPAYLMHIVLDQIVDSKFITIEALEDELDAAEDNMLADISRFDPGELLRLRRDLLALRKSLFHEREILIRVCRKDCPFIPEKVIFPYRDIYDHLVKFFELTETYREIVTSLMEMYLSILNNQMTRLANETNATVRRLTFITTIFMPLTLLAGIGGMSEWSMMTGPSNWKIAYPLFMLAMAVLGLGSYFLLKLLEKRGRPAKPTVIE